MRGASCATTRTQLAHTAHFCLAALAAASLEELANSASLSAWARGRREVQSAGTPGRTAGGLPAHACRRQQACAGRPDRSGRVRGRPALAAHLRQARARQHNLLGRLLQRAEAEAKQLAHKRQVPSGGVRVGGARLSPDAGGMCGHGLACGLAAAAGRACSQQLQGQGRRLFPAEPAACGYTRTTHAGAALPAGRNAGAAPTHSSGEAAAALEGSASAASASAAASSSA